jgi:hypothetical protein
MTNLLKKLNYQTMKATTLNFLLFFIFLGWNCVAQAQSPEKAATHFYIVNFDTKFQDFFSLDGNSSDSLNYALTDQFTQSIADSMYVISANAFKNDLGLELLPLTELRDKVRYNSEFPNYPDAVNIKKVLKSASGYKYYVDFYINVFSGFSIDPTEKPSLNHTKPIYAISFTLYNGNGNILKKIQFSHHSKELIIENPNTTDKKIYVETLLCNLYEEAIKEFTTEYKAGIAAAL